MKPPLLWYLSSPHSHEDYAVREARYHAALKTLGELLDQGLMVFSPIVHSHDLYKLPGWDKRPVDFVLWEKYDTELISRCDGILILMIDGWKESKGIKAEIEICRAQNKPVMYLEKREDRWHLETRGSEVLSTDLADDERDPVNPSYYQGDSVMSFIENFGLNFRVGQIVKYCARHRKKKGLIDLKKALWYLKREIQKYKE